MHRISCRSAAWAVLLVSSAATAAQPPAPRFEEQFQRLDRDGDGRLSQDEAAGRPFLQRADSDGDGFITRDEARAALETLRPELRRVPAPRRLPEAALGIARTTDVPYTKADGPDSALLALDVYRPKDADALPVMVYVHGGGWTKGDKQAVGNKVPFFCDRGYVFISVNYRLLPQTKVPQQAQDVASAVAWVHDHAGQFGGDPDRIFLMGHSAGAHLVSLVATNEALLANCGKDLSVIRGLIELDTGALDVPRLLQEGGRFHSPLFGDDPETHRQISPFHHVAPGKSIPPFLLVVADGNRPKLDQAQRMAEKLRQAGVRAEVVEATDKTHGTLNQDLGLEGDKVTETVMRFLASAQESWKAAP